MAPAYDVVCTMVYPLDQTFSIEFGGARTLDSVTPGAVAKAARTLKITESTLKQLIDDVTTRLVESVDEVCHVTGQQYGEVPVLASIRDQTQTRSLDLRDRTLTS